MSNDEKRKLTAHDWVMYALMMAFLTASVITSVALAALMVKSVLRTYGVLSD